MIKGCSRRMVILKDTGSDFFEEAYFVLKTDSPFCSLRNERDFLNEANRIVSENRSDSFAFPQAHQPKFRLFSFFIGIAVGAAVCAAAFWGFGVLN